MLSAVQSVRRSHGHNVALEAQLPPRPLLLPLNGLTHRGAVDRRVAAHHAEAVPFDDSNAERGLPHIGDPTKDSATRAGGRRRSGTSAGEASVLGPSCSHQVAVCHVVLRNGWAEALAPTPIGALHAVGREVLQRSEKLDVSRVVALLDAAGHRSRKLAGQQRVLRRHFQ